MTGLCSLKNPASKVYRVSFASWCASWQTPCQVAVSNGEFGACGLGGWPDVGVSLTQIELVENFPHPSGWLA